MKAYAIKDPKGEIVIYTVSKSAKLAKAKFCQITSPFDWKKCYKEGFRCVQVTITEVKP